MDAELKEYVMGFKEFDNSDSKRMNGSYEIRCEHQFLKITVRKAEACAKFVQKTCKENYFGASKSR